MTSTALVATGPCPTCGLERASTDRPHGVSSERVWDNLERVERALLAIYDDGVPATDQDRWALIGYRDGLVWALSAAVDE